MKQTTPGNQAALREQLTQAILAQDMETACKLLESLPPPGDAALDQMAARLYMATQNWPHAADILARLQAATPQPDIQLQSQLNLARNLTQARIHQPDLYHVLMHTPALGQHHLHLLPQGRLTIARQRPGQSPLLLSASADPDHAAEAACKALLPVMNQGNALGLNGTGDGRLLLLLAQRPPQLLLHQTLTIHFFEPEAEVLLHAMRINDFTGLQGPLQQPRFQWHVGPGWREHYQHAMLHDTLSLPEPLTLAQLSGDVAALDALLQQTQGLAQSRDASTRAAIQAHYQDFDPHTFAALCSDHPPRRPRVLLVTSRFTTVLQYEIQRMAKAFEQLGWQTRTAIEPEDHHRMLTGFMRQAIDAFKPDLFFTLDHLRREQGDIVPPGLPYCCWVQDLLENITTIQAGQSVGGNDWVITFCTPLLTGRYAYPPSRCIDAPIMMASQPTLPPSWSSDGVDLAYVSNLSQDTQAMVDHTLQCITPVDRPLVRHCCQLIVEHYQAGQSLPGKTDIGRLIAKALHNQGRHPSLSLAPRQAMLLIDALWNPLNIGLYRQQALRWVAQVAREENLTLALFGRGWENHPEFATYARGVIQPGRPLEELVRGTKINLNLEPYPCTTHVRLLDGLTAGGFYLLRDHPANAGLPELADFIQKHAPAAAHDHDALAQTPPAHQHQLRELLARTAGVSYDHPPDVVAQMRCYQRAHVMAQDSHQPLLPALQDITFHDLASCRQRIQAFIPQAGLRRSISQRQREAVLQRLTLVQGLKRVVHAMRESIGAGESTKTAYAALSA